MRKHRIRNICLILIGMLIIALVIVRISLAPIVHRIVGPAAAKRLAVDVSLQGFRAGLLRGKAGMQSISIGQPAGFQQHPPFFQIQGLSMNLATTALVRKHIRIQDATIDTLALHLVRDQAGQLNVKQLGGAEPTKPEQEPVPEEPDKEPGSAAPPPRITVDRLLIRDAVISFSDYSTDPPIQLACTNMNLQLTNLVVDSQRATTSTNLPGAFLLTTTILQPGRTNGFAGISAAIGVLGTNVPPAHAALRIVGFDIRTLSGLLPTGMATALGGDRIDLIVDASVAPDMLLVQTRLDTAGNSLRLNIGGTPDKPVIAKDTALLNLLMRPGAFIANRVGDAADAGVEAGKTVFSTAEKAGSGILGGIANVGRSAANTVTSAAQGDTAGIAEGLKGITIGTVTGAVDTVSATTRTATEGIGQSFSTARGKSKAEGWQADTRQRWTNYWHEARQFTTHGSALYLCK